MHWGAGNGQLEIVQFLVDKFSTGIDFVEEVGIS